MRTYLDGNKRDQTIDYLGETLWYEPCPLPGCEYPIRFTAGVLHFLGFSLTLLHHEVMWVFYLLPEMGTYSQIRKQDVRSQIGTRRKGRKGCQPMRQIFALFQITLTFLLPFLLFYLISLLGSTGSGNWPHKPLGLDINPTQ